MDYSFRTESGVGLDLSSMLGAVTGVITNPVRFFKDMPKSGGFGPPVIFTLMMILIACAFQALLSMLGLGFLSMLGLGFSMSFPLALAVIVIFPVLWAIFSFSCAAFWYFIWWLMGSQESFETAYRCVAYASAISFITSLRCT